jgi:GTP-binding protein EngB required for normal cell division
MSLRDQLRKNNNLAGKRETLMKDIQTDYKQNDEYEVSQVALKNIILVGRTRTGKSTIKSLLVNPTTVPEDLKIVAGTKSPTLESYHVTRKNVVLNIIDTPGFVERGTDELDARDNDNILKIIDECINQELTKCHVICFCIAITCGINEQDFQILRLLFRIFGDSISSNACLIVTHCESKNEDERAILKSQLSEDVHFKKLVGFFKLGIFFSGALNPDDYNTANESLLDQFVAISEYRTTLIEIFTGDIVPFPLDTTGMSELKRVREAEMLKEKELHQTHKELQQNLSVLEKTEDELRKKSSQLQDMQLIVEEHTRSITALKEQLITNKHKQEELKTLLEAEEGKRRQAEEILKQESQAHRRTEEKLQSEKEFNILTKEQLDQTKQAHRQTEKKLQQEQEAGRALEIKYKRENENWRVLETKLCEKYKRQVDQTQEVTRRLQEVEGQRDEALRRLNKSESLLDRLRGAIWRLLSKKSQQLRAATPTPDSTDKDLPSQSSTEIVASSHSTSEDHEEHEKEQEQEEDDDNDNDNDDDDDEEEEEEKVQKRKRTSSVKEQLRRQSVREQE